MKQKLREYEADPLLGDTKGEESSSLECFKNEYIIHENFHVEHNTSISVFSTNSISRIFLDLFLPLGYPHSVDPSYLPYQLYDGLQGLCSYWRAVVSTKAVLEASGVGNADATALSAAMSWALRDGTGMVGGLVFSYFFSQYFDTHVKEFRLFADVINDVALTLDMLAPAAGDYSMWVLSLSTLCKTMCGMSAGATKGRITQHFARENGNMADLTAKESTQETLVSLMGMIGGVLVARMLEDAHTLVTWCIFLVLTALHVWANYKGVMLLRLATLNPERTQVLLKDTVQAISSSYISEIRRLSDAQPMKDASTESISPRLPSTMENLLSPDQISESFLSSMSTLLYPTLLVARPLDPSRLDCLDVFQQEKYVLAHGGGRFVYIWLCVGATKSDELQSYVHAMVMQALLDQGESWGADLAQGSLFRVRNLFHQSQTIELMDCLEKKGWDVQSRLYLGFSPGRISWSSTKEE